MAKSFCYGCKHWRMAEKKFYDTERFHFCLILLTDSLKKRKELCNGDYYENYELNR